MKKTLIITLLLTIFGINISITNTNAVTFRRKSLSKKNVESKCLPEEEENDPIETSKIKSRLNFLFLLPQKPYNWSKEQLSFIPEKILQPVLNQMTNIQQRILESVLNQITSIQQRIIKQRIIKFGLDKMKSLWNWVLEPENKTLILSCTYSCIIIGVLTGIIITILNNIADAHESRTLESKKESVDIFIQILQNFLTQQGQLKNIIRSLIKSLDKSVGRSNNKEQLANALNSNFQEICPSIVKLLEKVFNNIDPQIIKEIFGSTLDIFIQNNFNETAICNF